MPCAASDDSRAILLWNLASRSAGKSVQLHKPTHISWTFDCRVVEVALLEGLGHHVDGLFCSSGKGHSHLSIPLWLTPSLPVQPARPGYKTAQNVSTWPGCYFPEETGNFCIPFSPLHSHIFSFTSLRKYQKLYCSLVLSVRYEGSNSSIAY